MKVLLFTSISLLFLAMSCQKKVADPITLEIKSDTALAKSDKIPLPDNTQNPFDHVGKIHNRLMDSLIKNEMITGDTTRIAKRKFLRSLSEFKNIPIDKPDDLTLEQAIYRDYKKVLQSIPLTSESKAFLKLLIASLESISLEKGYTPFFKEIIAIETEILSSKIEKKEMGTLLVFSSVLRHSGFYWMDTFSNKQMVKGKGILGLLRKIAGVITAISADASTAAWHYAKNSPYDHMVEEAIRMSVVCGYYTGWYPELNIGGGKK
jgi:hypothetical protein